MSKSSAQQKLQALRQRLQKGLTDGKQALEDAANSAKNGLKNGYQKYILYVPKDYKGDGNGLNDFVKEAEALGIEVHRSEKNQTELAKEIFGTTEKLFGLTERGIALFAPQLDKLLQKSPKTSGTNSHSINSGLGKAQSVLSTLQSFLGSATAGMELDSLIRGGASQEELAKASIDLINEIVGSIAGIADNIDTFSEQIGKVGSALQQIKGFSGLGNKLQNLPDFGKAGYGLDALSGLLSAISAGFILGNKDSSTEAKAAAGVELTSKVLGNISKAASQYILAQRAAAGLSTTGAVAGLVASVVSLAISPLSFLGIADKFKRAQAIKQFATRFQKFGYDGDSLLAEFYEKTGIIEASITTINTALNAISAGVGAASTASLVGAPIGLLVSGITGLITGILEASKQSIFESVANQLADKISDWEKKHGGKNYFENGYDARHEAYLEDSLDILANLNKEYNTEQVITITQQRWDEQIGELSGITRNGHRSKSGKAYINAFEDGKRIKNLEKLLFTKEVFDPAKGVIDLRYQELKSLYLTFTTPVLPPGEEIRERKQTGKYSYVTELVVNRIDRWQVYAGDVGSTLNFTNLIQHARLSGNEFGWNNTYAEAKLIVDLGRGDDKIFLGAGSAEIDGGEGHDIVYYDKTDTGWGITIDGRNKTEAGSYSVKRDLEGIRILQEVTKTQTVSGGKRTEEIQYRDYELQNNNTPLTSQDSLKSIEEVIGSNKWDYFYGSKFNDIFHGADGNDVIFGEDGDDKLFGDDGDDSIEGGKGNDQLFGGNGNDKLYGNNGGNNFLDGGADNDHLEGANGNDQLFGGEGNDVLYGNQGNDLLDGGDGNDVLNGGEDDDIYIYKKSYGYHQIKGIDGNDKLSLTDASIRDLSFSQEGLNLDIKIKGGNGHITLVDWFAQGASTNQIIEEIVDKDHQRLNVQQINYLAKPGFGDVNKLISASASFKTSKDYGIASTSLFTSNEFKNYANSLAVSAA